MRKTAIYIRVSTEDQAREGYSIEAQKRNALDYCRKKGYENYEFYIDEGISAKTLKKRPQVMRLIEDVKNNRIDVVVVFKLDRFSRKVRDIAELIDLFQKHDARLESLTEELDISSQSGRAMIQMLGVFAEFEREQTAERVKFAKEQRAKQGLYAAPGRMLGYDYDKATKQYIINPEEAAVVRDIFRLHQEGKGCAYIARYLNNRGIKTITGGPFGKYNIIRIFKNGWYYCGKFEYTLSNGQTKIFDAKNIPEPIIDYETFLRSHKIYSNNQPLKVHPDSTYIFKGKARCAYCGVLMNSNYKANRLRSGKISEYRYYKCPKRYIGLCHNKHWISTVLDRAFVRYLKELSEENPETILSLKQKRNDIAEKIKVLEDRIQKEENRKKRAQLLFIDDLISLKDYNKLIADMASRLKVFEDELVLLTEELNRASDTDRLEAERKLALDISSQWMNLTNEQKREFLAMFVKSIYLDNDGITKIEFII